MVLIQHPHHHLDGAVGFVGLIAIVGVHIVDHERAGSNPVVAVDIQPARGGCYRGGIVDGGDGDGDGLGGKRIGLTTAARIATNGRTTCGGVVHIGSALCKSNGQGYVTINATTVGIVVDIAGSGVEHAAIGVCAVEVALQGGHAAAQCDGATTAAHRYAVGQVARLQRAAVNGQCYFHRCAKSFRLLILEIEARDLVRHIFLHGNATGHREGRLIIYRGHPQLHLGDVQVQAGVLGNNGRCPVVGRAVNRLQLFTFLVLVAAVGDNSGTAVLVGHSGSIQAVVHNDLQLVILGISVDCKAHAQGFQGGVDVGHRASQLQVAIAGGGAGGGGTGNTCYRIYLQAVIHPGQHLPVRAHHTYDDRDQIDFLVLRASWQVGVLDLDIGNDVVGRVAAIHQQGLVACAAEFGLVVAGFDLDFKLGGSCWCLPRPGHTATYCVVDPVVAIADGVFKIIAVDLPAVVLIADAPSIQIGLGKDRAHAQGLAIQQQLAVLGCRGNAVLDLVFVVVRIGKDQLAIGLLSSAGVASPNGGLSSFVQAIFGFTSIF